MCVVFEMPAALCDHADVKIASVRTDNPVAPPREKRHQLFVQKVLDVETVVGSYLSKNDVSDPLPGTSASIEASS